MEYQIVFLDIDGTLINEEKIIPPDTLEAIQELQRNKIEVVLATGRAHYYFDELAKQCGIDSYVSCNGAYVVYQGTTIYDRPIPTKTLDQLQQIAAQHDHPILFQGSTAGFSTHKQHPYLDWTFQQLKLDSPDHNADFAHSENIYQALLFTPDAHEQQYREELPALSFIRWHEYCMDVFAKGGSKALGIEALLSHIGLAPSKAVAFGDGLNDKEMLSYVGMGIAMGNAHEALLPHANYVTRHVDDGGISHGLRHIGLMK
ncbi:MULTISPECIES: Cof-type HAD-IIB family hydrolase [unclassified Brevibacillus]|uniref:Cof-type HAD-IIB family hydrolase n=1 Tax=unclassified Brevibacillus TaxID=2684853 RepID=UPI003569B11C